jgi:hypothetical protein
VKLTGYSDADMASDIDTWKSKSNAIFFLDNSPITWQSTKKKVVALSSCEAEYIVTATTTYQKVWLTRLLSDLVGKKIGVLELNVDNMSAFALTKNPIFHDILKHIATPYHYI